jgi:ribonuclease HII
MGELSLKELHRLGVLTLYEREARRDGYHTIAGVDEAGRGPLAGPVVAVACILPENLLIAGVDDSKKLTPLQRCRLFERLTTDRSILYGIGILPAEEIDRLNIYQATLQAMVLAIANLPLKPDLLLIDGMTLPQNAISQKKIIGGDSASQSIAAASIIAKETRDRLMVQFHEQWPAYGFDRHKGYGTPFHVEVLERLGPTPIHRRSFDPLKSKIQNCGVNRS